MGDPFEKKRPGEDVFPISARAWNAMLSAGQAFERRKHDRTFDSNERIPSGSIIRVKNQSGIALNRGNVLGLMAPIFTPEQSVDAFLREVCFRGTTPDSTLYKGKFAVTIDPIDVGGIGRACVDGFCNVQVDIKDPKHTCADVTDRDVTKLTSMATGGSAQIIWAGTTDASIFADPDNDGDYAYNDPGGDDGPLSTQTGVQWCTVRLGTNCKICCHSSSSSSSSNTSHHCPTQECSKGCGAAPAPCGMHVSVNGLQGNGPGGFFCAALDCDYYCYHTSGCHWHASFGSQSSGGPVTLPSTCDIDFDGTDFTITVIDIHGDIAVFRGPFDCQTPTQFGLQSTNCPACDPCPPNANVFPFVP